MKTFAGASYKLTSYLYMYT